MNKELTNALNHALRDKTTGINPWVEFVITGLLCAVVAFAFGHLIALAVL